jgi:hypothetical protein
MKIADTFNYNAEIEPLATLIKAMRCDPVINKKVTILLKMDSYPRHIVLSSWLEQLRRNHASKKLAQTLSYLFDDIIAEKVLTLINNHNYQKNKFPINY